MTPGSDVPARRPPGDIGTGGRKVAGGSPLVELQGVSLALGGRSVLSAVDLAVRAGEILTLIGPNGSGKTTLVRLALGLLRPDQGRVERPAGLRIGYVPQRLEVDPTLPLTVGRFLALCAPRKRAAMEPVLAEVGVGGLLDSPLQSVSGGELKRILLAQALLREPDLLVLDEPSAGVDIGGQTELYGLIRRIRDRTGCGVLLVSHDLHLVMAATDQVVCLNHHVCCIGQPEAVSRHPEYLALFGDRARRTLAVYTHHHDHDHDLTGEPVVPVEHPRGSSGSGHSHG